MYGQCDRRTALALVAGGLGALAGCGGPGEGSTASADGSGSQTAGTGTADGDGTGTDATGDLDLREANAVDVAVTAAGDGRYRFDVTLYHDDDGEDGYADWWQVESLDGERLGRRDLAHPHGTQRFTRSATVSVPEETACVVVRGHDRTHGYGGRAMLVAPERGATRAVAQGSEPRSFADATCP